MRNLIVLRRSSQTRSYYLVETYSDDQQPPPEHVEVNMLAEIVRGLHSFRTPFLTNSVRFFNLLE
jgi:hypothetical protein